MISICMQSIMSEMSFKLTVADGRDTTDADGDGTCVVVNLMPVQLLRATFFFSISKCN